MNEVENENIIGDILTPRQESFCQNYTQNYELFGNATLAYAESYGFDLEAQPKDDAVYEINEAKEKVLVEKSSYQKMYDMCSGSGSRLRRNAKIQERCRQLLNEFMNDQVIDARLTEIIINGRDEHSINAIKEYNKLKARITEKIDHTTNGESIAGFNFIRAEENKDNGEDNTNNQTNP